MAQKYYHSGLSGAPVLNGTAGSLISLFDAVLKDGWGVATATSVVIAGGVATATFASAHAAEVDITVRVAGATPSSLNGDKMVTAKSGNTISWSTTEADGTATGTITVKIAPLDFTKPFSGTNKAVYKSSDPAATGFHLRLDDAGTTTARVVGYESMSDVDTGTNAFPTSAQFGGGLYWIKSSTANSTAIPWEIVGDERGFYLIRAPQVPTSAAYTGRAVVWFGDIRSAKSGDACACVLVGAGSATTTTDQGHVGRAVPPSNKADNPTYVARSYTQIGTSAQCITAHLTPFTGATSATSIHPGADANNYLGSYPFAADSSLRVTNGMVFEAPSLLVTDATLRGDFPGLFLPTHFITAGLFAPRDTIVGTGPMAGSKLLACPGKGAATALTSLAGCTFIDIKGSWR